jgi:hypothetical protein
MRFARLVSSSFPTPFLCLLPCLYFCLLLFAFASKKKAIIRRRMMARVFFGLGAYFIRRIVGA